MATIPYTSASLYVGGLGPEVTEANLYEIFNPIGPITSIRVCKDSVTRRSLGYAYVNFISTTDAERAMEQLNNSLINGRPCRIMWSQRDPSLRKSGQGNIFIKNLDKDIDNKELYDTFSAFGKILSCKIELNEENKSKGYGYIQFSTSEEAEKAVQSVNGMKLKGNKVFVAPFVSKRERIQSNISKKFTNIFVKNLPESLDDEKFKEIFGKYGKIQSAVIMKDEQKKSKGFGFINYETPEEAQSAVENLNNTEIEGKTIYVGRAQKKYEREMELKQQFEQLKKEKMAKYQGVNLYIKNLEDDITDDTLRSLFSPFGNITSAKIMTDSKGNSKGFGFVCFTSPEEATKAATEMNGKMIGRKPLYVALAQKKEIRKAQLEAQFSQRNKLVPPISGIPPIYSGAPMFFPPTTQGFVYSGMVSARGRYPPYQSAPNYLMVNSTIGRGQVKNGSGRGGNIFPTTTARRGMKQPISINSVPVPIPIMNSSEPFPLTSLPLSQLSLEEQKNILGGKLYSLISNIQPQLAGKITGMILESSDVSEIIQLIENPDALYEKVEEALKVLKEHNEKQQNNNNNEK